MSKREQLDMEMTHLLQTIEATTKKQAEVAVALAALVARYKKCKEEWYTAE